MKKIIACAFGEASLEFFRRCTLVGHTQSHWASKISLPRFACSRLGHRPDHLNVRFVADSWKYVYSSWNKRPLWNVRTKIDEPTNYIFNTMLRLIEPTCWRTASGLLVAYLNIGLVNSLVFTKFDEPGNDLRLSTNCLRATQTSIFSQTSAFFI